MNLIKGLAILLAAGQVASGQRVVEGRVLNESTGDPVAGVVVAAVDSAGRIVSRSVTDARSGFRMTVPSATVLLRLRRIGYAPLDTVTSASAIAVRMRPLPTQLAPIVALDEGRCGKDDSRGAAAALWEQARVAMQTSIVARESRPARVSILHSSYTSVNRPNTLRRILRDSAADGFVAARSPEAFAEFGYEEKTPRGPAYLAPSDVVLADESFVATHCFSIDNGGSRRDSIIGVRFEPSKGRDKLIDIEGVVWLRRKPLDVISVEFEYTGFPHEIRRRNPGGTIRFTAMPNGITMLSEWMLKTATTGMYMAVGTGVPGLTRVTGQSTADQYTGAVIESIHWPDSVSYLAELPVLTGIVHLPDTRTPAPGVEVILQQTPYRSITDSTGRFSFRVPAASYRLLTGDSLLLPYGIQRGVRKIVELKGPRTEVEGIEGSSRAAMLARACDGSASGTISGRTGGPGIVFGRLEFNGPQSLGRWQPVVATITHENGVALTNPVTHEGKTDEYGYFRLCGWPASSVTKVGLAKRPELAPSLVETRPSEQFALVRIAIPRD